jgi:hypothetical protein
LIYADPPWTFTTYSRKGKGRSAEAHYDCLSLSEIKALPINSWAADDSILLLWTTDPLLEKGLEVVRAWGFTYKTVGFYWAKQNASTNDFFTGMGFWTRANPEQCLLATRGNPKRRSASVRKLVVAPRREHSRGRGVSASRRWLVGPTWNCLHAPHDPAGTLGARKLACLTVARFPRGAGGPARSSLLLTAAEIQVAIVVRRHDVAGIQPAVRYHRLRRRPIVPVARRHAG